jgi:hypothetical protein
MEDVGEEFRDARMEVEAFLNLRLSGNDYGAGLEELAFIGMILSADGPPYKEIRKYSKREKSAEFRLRIDHAAFKSADKKTQCSLIAEAVARAIALLPTLGIKELDQELLEKDFRAAVREKSWMV